MMKKYTKREFLQLMGGLSIGLLPMAGCYEKKDSQQKNTNAPAAEPQDTTHTVIATDEAVTEEDIILLTRNEAAYAQYNACYNKQVNQFPKYIAVCKTDKGIAFAVKKAKEEKLPVCIKSGGHSFEGFSTNEGGMVINVSPMKNITWTGDNEVEVGPGLKLSEVHDSIYAKGKLLPAGSCGGVGIAGLALGGGYGFFSRKHGLTCDSLTAVKMIDANGNVKEVSGNDDLLWACRGAGNGNFGVVSSMRFKVYELPKNFASYNIYYRQADVTVFSTVLEEWFKATALLPQECFSAFVLNGKTVMMLFTNYGTEDITPLFATLRSNATSFAQSTKPTLQAIKRFYGRKDPLYFKNASCGYYNGFADLENIAAEIFSRVTSSPGMVFQVNTMGGNIAHETFKKGSAFPHRDMQYLGELQSYYETAGRYAKALEQFESLQQLLKDNGVSKHYVNYPDVHFSNWQQAYYGDNYEKLQQIKKAADPNNIFRYAQSIEIS
ncbi:MAG: FAD-binding oxidoreductase [Ferruginibacter sp.]